MWYEKGTIGELVLDLIERYEDNSITLEQFKHGLGWLGLDEDEIQNVLTT